MIFHVVQTLPRINVQRINKLYVICKLYIKGYLYVNQFLHQSQENITIFEDHGKKRYFQI